MLTRLNNNSGLDGSLASAEGFQAQRFQQGSDGPVESVLVARVARLTNDGSTLGPGSYNVDQSSKVISASPRGAIKWSNSKSVRQDYFTKTFTQKNVGPGSYNVKKGLNRTIENPTIPRAVNKARTHVGGFGKRARVKNSGSIRENYEDGESSDE